MEQRVRRMTTRAVVVLAVATTPALAGQVQIRDADTIVVDGTPVRLQGVDAPELGTRSGQEAKRWMVNFLRGKSVHCDLTGEKTYDRYVGVCYADGKDLGAAVIAAGYALDCRRYSGGRYRKLETPAARSRLKRAKYC
ncbi:nuclease homologue [Shimia gijangensis]|uniref:Nuclease homologue n=1 Tax=Shimia gijangensis TaxID=1470563 RepID=A0A1M6TUD8_9RHOB|nr:thermonuclease family protein [Shimia gijangensis]SHK60510.1 nuclease homologue [Shimia gijangensis]